MTEPEDDAVAGFELAMPFVVTTSHGGPFDDRSFVAGYQAGRLDRTLAVMNASEVHRHVITVYTDLLPQVDLLAMQHGFIGVAETHEDDLAIWSTVTFEAT